MCATAGFPAPHLLISISHQLPSFLVLLLLSLLSSCFPFYNASFSRSLSPPPFPFLFDRRQIICWLFLLLLQAAWKYFKFAAWSNGVISVRLKAFALHILRPQHTYSVGNAFIEWVYLHAFARVGVFVCVYLCVCVYSIARLCWCCTWKIAAVRVLEIYLLRSMGRQSKW